MFDPECVRATALPLILVTLAACSASERDLSGSDAAPGGDGGAGAQGGIGGSAGSEGGLADAAVDAAGDSGVPTCPPCTCTFKQSQSCAPADPQWCPPTKSYCCSCPEKCSAMIGCESLGYVASNWWWCCSSASQ